VWIWREEIAIEIDLSIWREEIGNRNRVIKQWVKHAQISKGRMFKCSHLMKSYFPVLALFEYIFKHLQFIADGFY